MTLIYLQARPIFRDPKRFPEMADPLMKNAFPMTSLNQAVGVAAMCLQEEASVRPLFGDVVAALSFLAAAPIEEPSVPVAPLPDQTQPSPENPNENTSDSDSSDDEDQNSENSSSSSDQSEDEGEGEESESRRGNSKRINSRSSSIRSNSSSSDDGNASSDDGNASDGLSPRRSRTAYKDDQESDSINWRNDRISDADEDVGDMSFCYSVNASMNLRSSSIAESDDGRSMRSSLRKEGSMKSENQNFGSYSSTSSDEELDEDKAWH
ncbi:unnamed protein product [Cuscuta epithymum]|uniref:Uncharacterized protein n=1 Tax=Cuscuta epithymum TaxID=186058 RepID=A0AAV0F391_9ASTE|nr:unnamed protein product [Cuscuta epithymum]